MKINHCNIVTNIGNNKLCLWNLKTNNCILKSEDSQPATLRLLNVYAGSLFSTGQFGCVYEGTFVQDGEELHVAVKSLLHGTRNEIANFLREGIMMRDFKHRNVLQLIGVCIKDDQIPLVVLPYMKLGDLLTYIRSPQHVSF